MLFWSPSIRSLQLCQQEQDCLDWPTSHMSPMLTPGVDSWCHSRCVRRFPVFVRWGEEVCYAGDGWRGVGSVSSVRCRVTTTLLVIELSGCERVPRMDIRSGHSMSYLVRTGAFHDFHVHHCSSIPAGSIAMHIRNSWQHHCQCIPKYDFRYLLILHDSFPFLDFWMMFNTSPWSPRLMGLGIANFLGAFFGAVPTQIGLSRNSVYDSVR